MSDYTPEQIEAAAAYERAVLLDAAAHHHIDAVETETTRYAMELARIGHVYAGRLAA